MLRLKLNHVSKRCYRRYNADCNVIYVYFGFMSASSDFNLVHYSDVTMTNMTSQITCSWLFVQLIVSVYIKENIKICITGPLWGELHWWFSHHKESVMWKTLQWNEVIMLHQSNAIKQNCRQDPGRYGGISSVNTLRQRQNGRHFPDDIFKYIFLNKNVSILIKISLNFVPRGSN